MLNIAGGPVGLEHLDFYVPNTRCSVEEYLRQNRSGFSREAMEGVWKDFVFEPDVLHKFLNEQSSSQTDYLASFSPEQIARSLSGGGMDGFHCAEGETSADMAVKIGRQVLAQSPDLAKSVDGLIYYHSTLNEIPSSSTACRLQYELGLKSTLAFSVSQKGGNSSLMALRVACEMLGAEPGLNTFLLIGSDKVIPPYNRVFGNMTVMGDSASAMVVRRKSNSRRLLSFHQSDFPAWWNPNQYGEAHINSFIDFISEKAALLVGEVMKELSFDWGDVTLLLPPNFNTRLIESLSVKAEVPKGKIYTKNTPKFGHLLTSDFVVNLSCAQREGRLKPGDHVLALNLGLGLSLGCVALVI